MPDDLSVRSQAGTALPEGAGPAALYRERAGGGVIRADAAQLRAVARLQLLHDALHDYKPAGPARRGLLARLGLGERPPEPPRGIYLWGPVGRGKSMLMDLFFASAPVHNKRGVPSTASIPGAKPGIDRGGRAPPREPVGKVAAD